MISRLSFRLTALLFLLTSIFGLSACSRCDVPAADPTPPPGAEGNASASPTPPAPSPTPRIEVTLLTDLERAMVDPIVKRFTTESRVAVRVVSVPDGSGEPLISRARIDAAAAAGQGGGADVLWVSSPVRAQPLLAAGEVVSYPSPAAEGIPEPFRGAGWIGVGARARVLLVNTAKVEGEGPSATRDLLHAGGRAAMARPAVGSALEHVAALFSLWEEPMAGAFLEALRTRGVRLLEDEATVIEAVSGGGVAWGVVDSDRASAAVRKTASLSIRYPDQEGIGALVLPTGVMLLKGAPHEMEARRLIDLLVDRESERALVGAGFMPLRAGVEAPPGLKAAGEVRVMQVSPQSIAEKMGEVRPALLGVAESGGGGP